MNQEIEKAKSWLSSIKGRTDHELEEKAKIALKYLSLWGTWKCEHIAKDELASDCPMCHLAWCEARIQVLEAELTRLRGKPLKQESEWCEPQLLNLIPNKHYVMKYDIGVVSPSVVERFIQQCLVGGINIYPIECMGGVDAVSFTESKPIKPSEKIEKIERLEFSYTSPTVSGIINDRVLGDSMKIQEIKQLKDKVNKLVDAHNKRGR